MPLAGRLPVCHEIAGLERDLSSNESEKVNVHQLAGVREK